MPADILRDQEAASPDFGALATAAGPVPAPVIKTSTPDFDAGANLQKTKLDLDAQREQQAQLQAQEYAVRDQAAQNSAQGAQNATAAIQAKQPQVDTALQGVQQAQQAYEGQAQPPSRQLTDFLSPVAGESPENTISKLIHGISLIATGWTGLARGDATAAMASLSGALKGWHEGDKVRADRAFADWKAKSDKLLADWEMRHKTAQDIFENTKLTTEQQLKMFELSRVASGDQISATAARTQGMDATIKSLQQDQKLWGEMLTAKESLEMQRDMKELTINIHAAQLQQAATQFAQGLDQKERFHNDEIAVANAKAGELKPTPEGILTKAREFATQRSYLREMTDLAGRIDLQKISGGTAPWVNKLIQRWGGTEAPPPGTTAGPVTPPEGSRWTLTSDEKRFLALVQDYGDLVLRQRSGATVNQTEMPRFLDFVPDQSMNAPTLMSRLNLAHDLTRAKDKIEQQLANGGGYRYPVIDTQNIGGGDKGGGTTAKKPTVLTSPGGLTLSYQ